jgi:hypothetical protein
VNVVVTAEARRLRRAVGVTAWCVLEELVLDATPDDTGRLIASTNVRRLAADVGVSKDTAARAVARLVRAGVVERVTSARGERGTFPAAVYAVDVARVAGLSADNHITTSEPQPPSPTQRTRTHSTPRINTPQPSLFDLPTPSL